MPGHVIFFLCTLSFLSGALFAGLGLTLLFALIPAAVLACVLYAGNVDLRVALLAALLLVAGNFYYLQDEYRYQVARSALPPTASIKGVVAGDPKRGTDYQSFTLGTRLGKISVTTDPAPPYSYGDTLAVEGKIEAPTPYQHGQHILGQMRNPKIMREASGAGNPLLAFLYGLKRSAGSSYDRLLAPPQSALLYGIIFGANEKFSPQFIKDLEQSGLRFITAIDGLHMQIVILIIFAVCASLAPRKVALILVFLFAFGFIALTGFTVSGIRAGLMAAVASLARHTGRLYVPHNVIALVALVLTLINPQVLLDVGFQLSFLAVIAIVYFLPVLRGVLHIGEGNGFLGWKESLLITISVQLATAPIVIAQFQSFSLTSFIASVLVVWMLPFIIVGGLVLAACSYLLYPLAFAISFIVAPMIDYVLIIVNAFARLSVLFDPKLGFVGTAVYYGVLVFLMYWFYSMRARGLEVKKAAPRTVLVSAEAAGYEIIEIE
ncbi:MAG: ComEC/Rec2 family competence protein [Patescibacteria group bacterium]|nr:ComEC/Rec2 family competence protein [Patescibacteria group bacterium]